MDEMTGAQALERAVPTQPMKPSQPECQEFEYIRHGAQRSIITSDVTTGQIIPHPVDLPRTPTGSLSISEDFQGRALASTPHLLPLTFL